VDPAGSATGSLTVTLTLRELTLPAHLTKGRVRRSWQDARIAQDAGLNGTVTVAWQVAVFPTASVPW
jgi:hypothetical protein